MTEEEGADPRRRAPRQVDAARKSGGGANRRNRFLRHAAASIIKIQFEFIGNGLSLDFIVKDAKPARIVLITEHDFSVVSREKRGKAPSSFFMTEFGNMPQVVVSGYPEPMDIQFYRKSLMIYADTLLPDEVENPGMNDHYGKQGTHHQADHQDDFVAGVFVVKITGQDGVCDDSPDDDHQGIGNGDGGVPSRGYDDLQFSRGLIDGNFLHGAHGIHSRTVKGCSIVFMGHLISNEGESCARQPSDTQTRLRPPDFASYSAASARETSPTIPAAEATR